MKKTPSQNSSSTPVEASHLESSSTYAESYSEQSFWDKVRRFAQKIGSTGLYAALILYYMLRDERIPLSHKTPIIGALGYLILPFDVIPDAILGVGFSDDVGVMIAALKMIADSVTPEHLAQAEDQLKKWFPKAQPPTLADLLGSSRSD